MNDIQPLTENQKFAFDEWAHNKDLFIHGSAGTGKTLIAFYLALREVLLDNADRVIVVRSTVPSRDMGFLPGSAKEKMRVYESPYYDICKTIYGNKDAYEILKEKGTIEFISTSHIRGNTFDNCVVVVDECQNMAWPELNTVMSRIGENCRFIYAGDTKQSDLEDHKGKYDLNKMIAVIKRMATFSFVQMFPDDVVRSGKAKQYILAVEALGF
tara:strand:+ start:90 stop:728 length:639 start_codon:yes stop_codon:yes gene_type:complete